jgi:hypothetical protein
MKRFIRFGALAPMLLMGAGLAHAGLITNGGFETGDFTGWTVTDQGGGSGSFFIQAGTGSPLNGFGVVAPAGGSFAAMTDQEGPGAHSLMQSFTVDPGAVVTLSFDLFRSNQAGQYFTPDSLDYTVNPNQQARVDILTNGAGPFDLDAAVLDNVFQTQSGDPTVDGSYIHYSFDITSAVGAGGTYQLRFAETDNQLFFNLGVDNVDIEETPEPGTWILLSTALLGLAGYRWSAQRRAVRCTVQQ